MRSLLSKDLSHEQSRHAARLLRDDSPCGPHPTWRRATSGGVFVWTFGPTDNALTHEAHAPSGCVSDRR